MKHYVLLFVFLGCFSFSFAQKTTADIRTAITEHRKAMEDKQYTKAVDYYYSKFFQIASKNEILRRLAALDENEMMQAKNEFIGVVSVSKVITVDQVEYAVAEYESRVTISHNDTVEEELILMVKKQIEQTEKRVSYSKEKRAIQYYRNSICIMINDNGWKLLPYSKKLSSNLQGMIPEAAFKKLNLPQ